jgi:hypothetical protein
MDSNTAVSIFLFIYCLQHVKLQPECFSVLGKLDMTLEERPCILLLFEICISVKHAALIFYCNCVKGGEKILSLNTADL